MTAGTLISVTAARLAEAGPQLLAPAGTSWKNVSETAVSLAPTPLDAQPSAYVRASWANRAHGALASVGLSAAVAGDALYLRLRWAAAEPRLAITDNDTYADACAVLFPLDGKAAELSTMGDERSPVQAWHWRAGTALPFVITATGLGTVTRLPNHAVSVGAAWESGSWSVIFKRDLQEQGVPLSAGGSVPLGIAVWSGANSERAGLKAHTPAWITLNLPK
jgi:DMSO reductase family type II enzyme heme b subunit